MDRAESICIDADTRAAACAWKIVSLARRMQPAAKIALTELGPTAGCRIPQLAQDKPVEPGIRVRPGKLVVRQSSGGEALALHGKEAVQEV